MTSSSNPSSSSNSKRILIIVAVIGSILLCCCLIASLVGLFFITKDSDQAPSPDINVQEIPETDLQPTQTMPEADPQQQTWLVLFYFDADDAILEEDIYFDLNEVELIGSTDRVKMVAQIDRSENAFSGDGDWTTARRYFLTQDSDLQTIHSELLTDLGEVDMGNRETLLDFTTWAIQTYPADKYVLIRSDHGSGWPGGWSDNAPSDANGNWLYLEDIEYALQETLSRTGVSQFELVGLDACLMSMLEVYNALVPYARYAVASQETEPAFGWAYTSFLSALTVQPEMSGAELARAIVNSYIDEDQRIRNDEARKSLLSSYGLADELTADALAAEMGLTITIAAVDLSGLQQVNDALGLFLFALKDIDQSKVAEGRAYTQAFYNVFGDEHPSPYLDLENFGNFMVEITNDQNVRQGFHDLQGAISAAVIAERHGNQRPGARGLSIYFPASELYWNEEFGYAYYAQASSRSADQTLWDDFLAYHYAGQEFGLGTPSKESRLPGPGSAQVNIAPLNITPALISPQDVVNIQTEIAGDNIANIYLVAMLKHEGRYLAYFIDYIKGDKSQNLNGVMYPVWERKDDKIQINLDWAPAPDGVCNGTTCAFALLNPDKYSTNSQDILYFVEGWYINAESGERTEATMYFNNYGDNLMRSIVTSASVNQSIALPRELIPTPGDQFMMLDTWWTLDEDGQIQGSYQEGNVLTFGDQPFYFVSVGKADPGEYAVGIMVEDMDGHMTYQFAPVIIR